MPSGNKVEKETEQWIKLASIRIAAMLLLQVSMPYIHFTIFDNDCLP